MLKTIFLTRPKWDDKKLQKKLHLNITIVSKYDFEPIWGTIGRQLGVNLKATEISNMYILTARFPFFLKISNFFENYVLFTKFRFFLFAQNVDFFPKFSFLTKISIVV